MSMHFSMVRNTSLWVMGCSRITLKVSMAGSVLGGGERCSRSVLNLAHRGWPSPGVNESTQFPIKCRGLHRDSSTCRACGSREPYRAYGSCNHSNHETLPKVFHTLTLSTKPYPHESSGERLDIRCGARVFKGGVVRPLGYISLLSAKNCIKKASITI
jgi:hypothetical protein